MGKNSQFFGEITIKASPPIYIILLLHRFFGFVLTYVFCLIVLLLFCFMVLLLFMFCIMILVLLFCDPGPFFRFSLNYSTPSSVLWVWFVMFLSNLSAPFFSSDPALIFLYHVFFLFLVLHLCFFV